MLVVQVREVVLFFFVQAEDGIRDVAVTGVQTCALPISGAGKVALVTNATPLTGTGCPLPAAGIGDYVGYGTASSGANCSEGGAAAPTLTNTTAAIRKLAGAQDTDNNGADFSSGAPTPRSGG